MESGPEVELMAQASLMIVSQGWEQCYFQIQSPRAYGYKPFWGLDKPRWNTLYWNNGLFIKYMLHRILKGITVVILEKNIFHSLTRVQCIFCNFENFNQSLGLSHRKPTKITILAHNNKLNTAIMNYI